MFAVLGVHRAMEVLYRRFKSAERFYWQKPSPSASRVGRECVGMQTRSAFLKEGSATAPARDIRVSSAALSRLGALCLSKRHFECSLPFALFTCLPTTQHARRGNGGETLGRWTPKTASARQSSPAVLVASVVSLRLGGAEQRGRLCMELRDFASCDQLTSFPTMCFVRNT